jgi:hypothetical protein
MSKRKYREAAAAKRLTPDDIAPDYSQAEYLAADRAYDRAKTDPAAWDQKLHKLHQDEVAMLRHLRAAL